MTNPVEKALGKIADRLADVFAQEGARTRAELAAGFTKTENANRVTGARHQALRPNALNSTSAGRLVGWSIAATADATIAIYDARDDGDPNALVAVIELNARDADTKLPAAPGISYGDGLYVAVTGGPVTGVLYFDAVR